MKNHTNSYCDNDRISDLVRQGIDRAISKRMNGPKGERKEFRANLQAFLTRYAGSGAERSLQEIEELVSDSTRR